MLKGLKDFYKKAEGELHLRPLDAQCSVLGASGSMDRPVILDPAARKFWKKYMERDKKVDVFFLWESLVQDFGHIMGEVDMVQAERSFTDVIDKNRNENVTNIEFNSWTRKLGLEASFKQILDNSKSNWQDDRDGQW